ncbi:hypothetical protein [Novosphingobium sp. ERN07]|nr:hypothetical protein [Novosphingobium sp. ERN07]
MTGSAGFARRWDRFKVAAIAHLPAILLPQSPVGCGRSANIGVWM